MTSTNTAPNTESVMIPSVCSNQCFTFSVATVGAGGVVTGTVVVLAVVGIVVVDRATVVRVIGTGTVAKTPE
jgi:hypothetical protein